MIEARGTGVARPGRRAIRIFAELPRLTRWGSGLLVIGLLIDVAAHLVDGRSTAADLGHLVVLAGMLIALGGVMTAAFGRRGRETRPQAEERRKS